MNWIKDNRIEKEESKRVRILEKAAMSMAEIQGKRRRPINKGVKPIGLHEFNVQIYSSLLFNRH